MAEGEGAGPVRTDDEGHSPTNILHAAYVGALELIKSMVAVSGCESFVFGRTMGEGGKEME